MTTFDDHLLQIITRDALLPFGGCEVGPRHRLFSGIHFGSALAVHAMTAGTDRNIFCLYIVIGERETHDLVKCIENEYLAPSISPFIGLQGLQTCPAG